MNLESTRRFQLIFVDCELLVKAHYDSDFETCYQRLPKILFNPLVIV